MDLSKAYDMICQQVAEGALRREEVSEFTIAVCKTAWKGPRTCEVQGELADDPIRPTRGLAQGDSVAPGGMCATLVPWEPSSAEAWLFMDDRSLLSQVAGGVQEAIDYTVVFDKESGAAENKKKRQTWSRGEFKRIEHIGVSVIPDDPKAEILPRDGWLPLWRPRPIPLFCCLSAAPKVWRRPLCQVPHRPPPQGLPAAGARRARPGLRIGPPSINWHIAGRKARHHHYLVQHAPLHGSHFRPVLLLHVVSATRCSCPPFRLPLCCVVGPPAVAVGAGEEA